MAPPAILRGPCILTIFRCMHAEAPTYFHCPPGPLCLKFYGPRSRRPPFVGVGEGSEQVSQTVGWIKFFISPAPIRAFLDSHPLSFYGHRSIAYGCLILSGIRELYIYTLFVVWKRPIIYYSPISRKLRSPGHLPEPCSLDRCKH